MRNLNLLLWYNIIIWYTFSLLPTSHFHPLYTNHIIGAPIFRTGWVPYNSLANLRDPYLDYLVADSRPFSYLPAHLRDAYISPVRRSVPRQPVRFGKRQLKFRFPFFLARLQNYIHSFLFYRIVNFSENCVEYWRNTIVAFI